MAFPTKTFEYFLFSNKVFNEKTVYLQDEVTYYTNYTCQLRRRILLLKEVDSFALCNVQPQLTKVF
jgi:hypothetical protein